MAQHYADLGKILVIIPTYNEIENIDMITGRLRASVPEAHILVVDDNSPDGTGDRADELAAADDHIHVLHRQGKEGLGAAYKAGFAWGLGEGYDVLVEFDADGSHQPEELPRLLAALHDADMVKGSRWVPGGSVVNWPLHRELLSRGGSIYTRLMLGLPVKDITGGLNAFRADTLRAILDDPIDGQGYGIQRDLTWNAHKRGYRIVEVPIEFVERERGESKMSGDVVMEALIRTTELGHQAPGGAAEEGPDARPRARPARGGERRAVRGRRVARGRDAVRAGRKGSVPMMRGSWVLLGLGVLAVAEIALLVWVAGEIGVGWTLLDPARAGGRRRRASCCGGTRAARRGRRCARRGTTRTPWSASSPTPPWCSSAACC